MAAPSFITSLQPASKVVDVYVVTGFFGWEPGGGQPPFADGIGDAPEARAGVLKIAIRIFRATGGFLTSRCRPARREKLSR